MEHGGKRLQPKVIERHREWLTSHFNKPAFLERLLMEDNPDDLSSDDQVVHAAPLCQGDPYLVVSRNRRNPRNQSKS